MNWKRSCAFILAASSFGISQAEARSVSELFKADKSDAVIRLENTGRAFVDVAKATTPAVVFIKVEQTVEVAQNRAYNPFEQFFGQQFQQPESQKYSQQGQGSGFIIDKNGYILTNSHVVNDADKITVTLKDGREFEAKLIGSDPKSEVALIKIDGKNLPIVALGDSDKIEVGEWAIAVGNPFGLSESVTAGIISAKERNSVGIAEYENFIQTDAAINPGNSGGPLINIDGEVIGINTAIYSRSGGYMGIGFAIPINMAKQIKDALIKDGKVQRSILGVYLQEVTPDLAKGFGLKDVAGVLISQVNEDSAAEDAGIKQGDIIVKLNGEDVNEVAVFRNKIAATAPNTEVDLSVFRDGKIIEIKAKTQAMDDDDSEESAAKQSEDLFKSIGLKVQELTEAINEQLGLDSDQTGVVVTDAETDEPAFESGLRRGMIIIGVGQTEVKTANDFRKALNKAKSEGQALLLVKIPKYGTRYIMLKLK